MKNTLYKKINRLQIFIFILTLLFGYSSRIALAEDSPSVLYVPLIGLTSVPEPLSLPSGPGDVTYRYAVKNFLREVALTDVQIVDDKCSSVEFEEGDDNNDSKLDYDETWRYICTTKLFETTQSIATVTAVAGNLTAEHKAYATVVVDSDKYPPLVSIVNITKVSYPISLPSEGGDITFVYRVNNPGVVPLANVSVTDDKCSAMSSKLGDTDGNNLLDIDEVWVYTCVTSLTETTTNTAVVTSYANGLKAVGYATITVTVDTPGPSFPEAGLNPTFKIVTWIILGVILSVLIILFFKRSKKNG
jgi:hypothetical protein